MNNPKWNRIANIAKVSLDLIELEMQMEWQNGNISRDQERQPVQSGEGIENDTTDDTENERDKDADSGTDY